MIDRLITLFIEVPAAIMIIAMMLHITANAIGRSMFNHPFSGTLEMTEYWYMPAIVMLGIVAAQHRDQHVAADLLFGLLPQVAQRIVLVIAMGVGSVISAGIAWFSLRESLYQASIGATGGTVGLPIWQVQFLVPLAFALLTVQLIAAAIKAYRSSEIEGLEQLEVEHAAEEFAAEQETNR